MRTQKFENLGPEIPFPPYKRSREELNKSILKKRGTNEELDEEEKAEYEKQLKENEEDRELEIKKMYRGGRY